MTAVRLTAKQARALGVTGPGKRLPGPKRKPLPAPPSRLEESFALLWRRAGGTVVTKAELLTPDARAEYVLVREYHFHEGRDWRFDFACLRSQVAVEIEGGTRGKSRHTSYKGFREDCEKYNAAALAGWRVFRLTGEMITPEWVERIREVLI